MRFEHKDFLVIANNEALQDFSSIEDHLYNKNIIHLNKSIHLDSFVSLDRKYNSNNYLCLNSWSHSKFHAYDMHKNRLHLFLGIFFIVKPQKLSYPYDRFQVYIDNYEHVNKEIISFEPDSVKTIINNSDPSAGFSTTYYLFNKFPESNITLVGFSGSHLLPSGKNALTGHPINKEQDWYKSQANINFLLSEKPCSENFHFPCRMCNAKNYKESLNKCFQQDKSKIVK